MKFFLYAYALFMTFLSFGNHGFAQEGNFHSHQFEMLKFLSPSVYELKDYEIKGNQFFTNEQEEEGKNLVQNQIISIEHYEIPLSLVKTVLSQMSAEVKKSLIFKKQGVETIRWIKNPDDTLHFKEVEAFLKKHKLDSTPKTYFTAYRTSSRSFILQDPQDPLLVFNAKVSTNNTAGLYKNKGIPNAMIEREMEVNKYVKSTLNKSSKNTLKIVPETGLFTLQEINQGMMIREIQPYLNEKKKSSKSLKWVPGFSIVHNHVGRVLAGANDSQDPAAFWLKNMIIPYAKALAEFFSFTKVVPSSMHSQNFYVELNSDYAPTGKVLLKDFGDIYYMQEQIKDKKFLEFITNYNKEDFKKSGFNSRFVENFIFPFRLFQTMEHKIPSWLDKSSLEKWKDTYFNTFEEKVKELMGLRLISEGNYSENDKIYYNWNLLKSDESKECFKAKSKYSIDSCREYFKCSMVYCYDQGIILPDYFDAQNDPQVVSDKISDFQACIPQGESACLQAFKKNVSWEESTKKMISTKLKKTQSPNFEGIELGVCVDHRPAPSGHGFLKSLGKFLRL